MVDDVLVPTKCNNDALVANAKVNTFMESKRLILNKSKCHKMHIEKREMNDNCSKLMVQNSEMSAVETVKYLGEQVSSDGKIDVNIEERYKKGLGINSQTLGLIKEISLGNHFFEIGQGSRIQFFIKKPCVFKL